MKKYRKRNTYFDSNNSDPNDKYNSNIDTFHNKKIQNYEKYEKVEIPKLEKKLLAMENGLKNTTNNLIIIEKEEETLLKTILGKFWLKFLIFFPDFLF